MNGDDDYIMTESENGYVMEIRLPYDSFAYAEAPAFSQRLEDSDELQDPR